MQFGEILGSALLVLLCLTGLTALLQALNRWLLSPGKEHEMVMLVPVRGAQPDAEQLLRGAIQRLRAMGGADRKTLLCVDCGLDDETQEICARFCADRPGMKVIVPEEISAWFHCNAPQDDV